MLEIYHVKISLFWAKVLNDLQGIPLNMCTPGKWSADGHVCKCNAHVLPVVVHIKASENTHVNLE